MSTQFLMWDKFKDMKKLSQTQREHLSRLLSQLLSSKAMSLSVLKVRFRPPPPQKKNQVGGGSKILHIYFSGDEWIEKGG